MSDPIDPILPPSSDEAQKNRHNRKGMRPKLPTLDLTATHGDDKDIQSSDEVISENAPSDRTVSSDNQVSTNESAPESSNESAVEQPDKPAEPEQKKILENAADNADAIKTGENRPSSRTSSRLANIVMLTAAGVIGGGLVYGLTTFIPRHDTPLPASSAMDTALEERVAKLEQAQQPTAPSEQPDQDINALVDARIADHAAKISQENAALSGALDTVNQKLVASLTQIQSLEEQFKQFSVKSESSPQGAALQEEITSLEKRLDNALAESQHQLTMNRSGGLILEIERALRYGRSFEGPLQQLKAVMPQIDISTLEAYAQAGVPRMHTIAGQLLHILNTTPYEEPTTPDTQQDNAGIWEHLKQSAASLVRVSPAGETHADEPRARVKAAVESEDWPTVLKEQQKLDNAAYNATRELATSLAARIEAEKALAALNTQLYSSPVIGPKPTE